MSKGRKPGRPSDYRAEYCARVIECMGRGFSLTAFAGEIRSCRDTVYEWMGQHPEFSDAVKRGRSARLRFLEHGLLTCGVGRATAFIFALKNACPDEWRDVTRQEHSGPNGQPIAVDTRAIETLAAEIERQGQMPAGFREEAVPIVHK